MSEHGGLVVARYSVDQELVPHIVVCWSVFYFQLFFAVVSVVALRKWR